MVNYADPGSGGGDDTTPATHHGIKLHLFPFEDSGNWWMYTEEGGNPLAVRESLTFPDDGLTYYRVTFQENRVDTTDDWFMRDTSGIFFSSRLIGPYALFLPDSFPSNSGSFWSDSGSVTYAYADSLTLDGKNFRKVVTLDYTRPFLHGFDRLILADSVGIVSMIDNGDRLPYNYTLDSAHVYGETRVY
jgi:hypothetical protein